MSTSLTLPKGEQKGTDRDKELIFMKKTFKRSPLLSDFSSGSSLGSLINKSLSQFSDSLLGNQGKTLIQILRKYLSGVLGNPTYGDIKVLCYFSFYLFRLAKTRGMKGLVLHLKSSHILTMQAIGGHRISDSQTLKQRVRRTKKGLPIVIPALHRKRIIRGDLKILKL